MRQPIRVAVTFQITIDDAVRGSLYYLRGPDNWQCVRVFPALARLMIEYAPEGRKLMMKYDTFSTEDFVLDPSFVKWVKNPNEEDEEFWSEWLLLNPDKESQVREACELVAYLNFSVQELDKDVETKTKNKIYERLGFMPGSKGPANQKTAGQMPWYRLAAVLSGVLITFSAGFYLYYSSLTTVLTTGYGEVKTVELSDGTVVTLNRNSTLRYGDLLTGNDRKVWLQGEAYFKVKRLVDQSKFIVMLDGVKVEVLGTEFNITSRKGKTRVVLNTGKLNVVNTESDHPESIMMKPGDLVEYNTATEALRQSVVQPEKYASWTKNLIVLEEVTIEDIANLLESTYGYSVKLEDGVKNLHFTGSIPADNITILFNGLVKTHALKVEVRDKSVVISKFPD